jgi:pimeloyl-ACP methyl ester carboxylesterase
MPLAQRGERAIHWELAGAGTAVLLVPGIGAGARQFGTLPRRFARAGFAGLSVSPVGCPPSTPQRGEFDFGDAARDLIAVLDAAAQPAVCAVGVSFGGLVALCAADLAPERFTGLALIGSAAVPAARRRAINRCFEVLAEAPCLGPAELMAVLTPFLFGQTFQERRPELVADIARAARPDAGRRALMAAQARAARALDLAPIARRVRCPVLCVAGEEDTLVPPADVAATAALLPAGTYVALPEVGHSPLLESAACFEQVVQFARALQQGR